MKNRWKFLKVKLPKPKPIISVEYVAPYNIGVDTYIDDVTRLKQWMSEDGIFNQYHVFFTYRTLTENSKADYTGWNIKMLSSHADDGELDLEKLIEKTKNITAE